MRTRVTAGSGLLALVCLLGGCQVPDAGSGTAPAITHEPSRAASADGGRPAELGPSRPVRVKVASLGVDAPVDAMGLEADGSVAVPPLSTPERVGWYDKSPAPGQVGPTVLLGHVTAGKKPGVFFKLKDLAAGAVVDVVREDGVSVGYRVSAVKSYPKTEFPTEEVYGDQPVPALRLVSCGGRWDAQQGHWDSNVIAFAERVS